MAREENNKVEISAYLSQIFAPIRDELAAWEITYQEALKSDEELFARLGNYVISYVDAKIRPALLLLSAKTAARRILYPEDLRMLVKLAAAVELIHTASLIHDDIIEKADLRRRTLKVNTSPVEEHSLLFGDYLFSKAFSLLSEIEIPEINAKVAHASNLICEGEAMELRLRQSLVLSEEDYLKIIKTKTASLISSACWLGAYIVEAKEEIKESLSIFGLNFGLAFQIVDDCLDVMAREDKAEKYLGRDLEKGKYALPLVYLLSFLPQEEKKRISDFLVGEKKDTPRVKTLAFSYRAVELALKKAKFFSDKAKQEIAVLPKSKAKESLIAIADFILERLAT